MAPRKEKTEKASGDAGLIPTSTIIHMMQLNDDHELSGGSNP
jgi:hypothetical protein